MADKNDIHRLEKMVDRMSRIIVDLRLEIAEGNGLLRSSFSIAKRDGKDTNWVAFRKQVKMGLTRQHKLMKKYDIKFI